MERNQNDQSGQRSDSKEKQLSAGKESEKPQIDPDHPFPDKPGTPSKPDENPDPITPEPGVNEPEKNDPTPVEDPPPVFNNG